MIRAIIETSLIDWDSKLTTVLFVDKCNFMCPFCQNWELLLQPEKFPIIEWKDIEKLLLSKKCWIDGVVLTGGEPLVYYEEVTEIASKIRALGLLVKLDTNGAYPEKLQKLIDRDLIDYVALDIKAPLDERYSLAAGKSVDVQVIKNSIDILINGTVDYEFRTTCVPGIIDGAALENIGRIIRGAKIWVLQQYAPANAYQAEYRGRTEIAATEMKILLEIARKYVANTKWRGRTH